MDTTTQVLIMDDIDEPVYAMRTEIDRDEVFDLANDIKKNGLINPITVRPRGDRYEVVAGHRRYLAHRYGGISTIRAIVRELTDDEAFAIMTSENLKRENVNPVDEATHVTRLMEMHNGDINKVSGIVGRGKDWIESRLAIGEMDDDYKVALKHERIKLGVALALSQITNDTDRRACLDMAISQGASVVVAQYWLAQWRAGLFGSATTNLIPDSNAPGGERQVVMLRCTVDGKDHPASDMLSVLVYKENVGYIHALREHLVADASATPTEPVSEPSEPVS